MSQSGADASVARAAATRAAIEETAERMFRTLGYQKTTVADIARDLGMSPANVYRFFPSKAAINEAICTRILDGLADLAWQIARGPGSPPARLTKLFKRFEEETISQFLKDRKIHDMVAAAMEEHWPVIQAHIRTIETAIRHIVMDGQAEGVFAHLDPEITARQIHAAMCIFTHPQVVAQCTEGDFSFPADMMAAFCLRALRPDSLDND